MAYKLLNVFSSVTSFSFENQEKRQFPIQIMRNPLLQNSSWVTFMFAILGENYSTTSKMCYAALDYGINLLQGCLESPLYFELYCLVCVQRPLCVFAFVFNGPPWLPLEHRLRHQNWGTPGFGFGAARLRVSAQLRVMDWCRCSYTRVHQIVGSNGK